MAVSMIGSMNNRFVCLSSDTKPTSAQIGATCWEYDAGKLFSTPDGDNWVLKSAEGAIFETTTVDLHQAAGDYDLFEVGLADVEILHFTIVIPADLTGTAAGSLTAISVATTDDTPVELISAAAGAKANLSSGAYLQYNGNGTMAAGKKIQLTIVGGATTAEQVATVFVAYREAV